MARKASSVPSEPSKLRMPRADLEAALDDRIAKGNEIAERPIGSEPELDAARSDYYTWSEYNTKLLERAFSTSTEALSYLHVQGRAREVSAHPDGSQSVCVDQRPPRVAEETALNSWLTFNRPNLDGAETLFARDRTTRCSVSFGIGSRRGRVTRTGGEGVW
jgi:hypothetical protein